MVFATALVLSACAAAAPSKTRTTASYRRAAQRDVETLRVKLALPAGVMVAQASGQVRLVLPQQPLTSAEGVPVMVINRGSSAIYRSLCFVLERRTSLGWRAITRTHGVNVGCSIWAGAVQAAHSRQPEQLQLYDDLRPGSYRVTLFYRRVPKHWRVIPPLSRRDRFVRRLIPVKRAPARPRPQLSEKRLERIAEEAAANAGDPQPSLIQHAAGPRFEAVLIGSGELVFEWTWSYLIAERGQFTYSGVGPSNTSISESALTLVVDATTGHVTDSGLSKRYPHLRRLGPITTDVRR